MIIKIRGFPRFAVGVHRSHTVETMNYLAHSRLRQVTDYLRQNPGNIQHVINNHHVDEWRPPERSVMCLWSSNLHFIEHKTSCCDVTPKWIHGLTHYIE